MGRLTDLHQQVLSTSTILKLGPIDTTISHEITRKTHKMHEYRIKNSLIAGLLVPFDDIRTYRRLGAVPLHPIASFSTDIFRRLPFVNPNGTISYAVL